MNTKQHLYLFNSILMLMICVGFVQCKKTEKMTIDVYETSEKGNALTLIKEFKTANKSLSINVNPEVQFQKIVGFGGSFTEASAYLLNKMSSANRKKYWMPISVKMAQTIH